MLITGAGGFAVEVLDVLHKKGFKEIAFYDDLSKSIAAFLHDKFSVLNSTDSARKYFSTIDSRFVLGIGGTKTREVLYLKMKDCGGELTSAISGEASIGSFGNVIMEGVSVMPGAILSNNIKIGFGTLVNVKAYVAHDAEVGNFCELSPGVNITGSCRIGNYCNIGTNATILPKVEIADNVIIGACALVTKDIKESGTYIGVPAKRIK